MTFSYDRCRRVGSYTETHLNFLFICFVFGNAKIYKKETQERERFFFLLRVQEN